MLKFQEEFLTYDHSAELQDERAEVRKRIVLRAEKALAETLAGDPVQDSRCLRRSKNMGAWLTVHPSTVNGMKLGAQKWQDTTFLRYGRYPPDLPKYCDVCNAAFSICHALDCKRGYLVTARHNDLLDCVADLAGKSFTQTHVHNNPLILASCTMKGTKANTDRSKTTPSTPYLEAMEQKDNLLIRDFQKNGIYSVHGMRVVNTDAKPHSAKTP